MSLAQPNTDTNAPALDVERVRGDFPALHQQVHGKPLVYLDNAATSQKPQAVLDTIDDYYRRYNANVHRGLHQLAELATQAYEQARIKVARFLNAPDARQVVFTRGCTEAINLVAAAWGKANLKAGDVVLVSEMEHHSNIVPWQLVAEATGATVKPIPFDDRGVLLLDAYEKLLSEGAKMVAVTAVSNSLGTINPIGRIVDLAHNAGAVVMADAAQAVPHMAVDVTAWDADFVAFSGHKVFGPTGIGALYGKAELLDAMPPYHGGGEMIEQVKFTGTTFAQPPAKFEAGTPNIAGAIALGAAIDYVQAIGFDAITAHEKQLLDYGTAALQSVDGLKLIGAAPDKAAVFSFTLDGIHPYDMSPVLDHEAVAIRTGHHCTQPVMDRFGIPATVRASAAFYNTTDEIDKLIAALEKVKTIFA